MPIARLRVEYVALSQAVNGFSVGPPDAHVDRARQHNEDLGAVILVPDVSLVRPMETHRRIVDALYVERIPGFGSSEIEWPVDLHLDLPSLGCSSPPAIRAAPDFRKRRQAHS